MTTARDREMQQWMDAWHASDEASAAPEAIRRHVGRRRLLFAFWVGCEIVVCGGMLSFLLHRVLTHPDPVEKLAMGLLALITVSALAFSWWNWRGVILTGTGATSAYIALSVERTRRFRRAVYVGWAILAAEVAVFVPWISYRLYAGPDAPPAGAERFGWGLLAGITAAAVVLLSGLHMWTRREARILDELRRELDEGVRS